jgi:hypothetical protein
LRQRPAESGHFLYLLGSLVVYLRPLFPLRELCLQLLTFELANSLVSQSHKLRVLLFELSAISRHLHMGIICFDHRLTVNAVTGDHPTITPCLDLHFLFAAIRLFLQLFHCHKLRPGSLSRYDITNFSTRFFESPRQIFAPIQFLRSSVVYRSDEIIWLVFSLELEGRIAVFDQNFLGFWLACRVRNFLLWR